MVKIVEEEGPRAGGRPVDGWNRRENIRAGAVSGPWRGMPHGSDATVPGTRPAGLAVRRKGEEDLRAPMLRPDPLVLTEPVRAPVILLPVRTADAIQPADHAFDPEDGEAEAAKQQRRAKARQYSVLGAILLGSLIAGAIIALAFLLEPAVNAPTQAVTPAPGAVVALLGLSGMARWSRANAAG